MARKPGSLPILRCLGETHQLKGQAEIAASILEKTLTLDPADKSTLFLLANAYHSMERYDKAIHHYKRLTFMRPVKNEVFYKLGVSYGRKEKLPLAHYYFGLYFKRIGNPKKAKYHFEKASSLPQADGTLRSRINKAMGDLK